MKKYILYKLVAMIAIIILSGCSQQNEFSDVDALVESATQSVEMISAEDLKVKLDEGEMIMLIDVREHNEHIYGYIPGAVNICRGVLEFRIGNEQFWEEQFLYPPEKTDEIIIYCKKGRRGVLAVNALKSLGFHNVKNLEGGWKGWELSYPLIYEKNLEEAGHGPVVEEGGC